MTAAPASPRAVIFDLDGTLADSLLDFDAIRAEIGLSPGLPILEQLADATPAERARAEEIMRRHELTAVAGATPTDGCADLLGHLAALEIPIGILTRNVREVVETFAGMFGFHFQAVYTREDGPHKPAPDGVLALCAQLGTRPDETLTVGDYKFDVIAGRRAGCRTVLLRAEPLPPEEHADWGAPDLVVASLRELLPLFAPKLR
ncbi:MAG TPA: HAD family hydrolase [Polyangia bacterium]|jgi:HAD superfamily hydrolase (TIGR01509 family)|nr:HAD family hydrolase [Polyangia bacterium]